MAARRLHHEQPESFAFDDENLGWAKSEVAKYPQGRQSSAVLALLWRAQEQEGWVTEPAIRYVADMLEMPYIRVYEVATFYTMLQLRPVGRHFVQVCGTTPCALRGAEGIMEVCKRLIGHHGEMTPDGLFTWVEVECMGACVNAPMAQISKDYFEDLTAQRMEEIIADLRAGREVKPGPQNGRQFSAPEGGPTTLLDGEIYAPKPHQPTTEVDAPIPDATAKPGGQSGEGPAPERPGGQLRANEGAADLPGERAATGKSAIPRGELKEEDDKAKTAPRGPHGEEGEPRPILLEGPREGKADDLQRIKGVGAKLEEALNRLGVYHYDQIASWTPENLRFVEANLGAFKGRAQRDNWIEQARVLAQGGSERDAAKTAPDAGSDA